MAGEYDKYLGIPGDPAAGSTPEPTEGAPEGAPASVPDDGGETISIQGKEYPLKDVLQWQSDSSQKGKWQATLKQEEMRNSQIRQFLSVATGRQIRTFGDLQAADFADLHVMANLNAWLGTHPDQKKPFEAHLKTFFEGQGASPAQAAAAAKSTMAAVADAGTGAKPDDRPEWAKELFTEVQGLKTDRQEAEAARNSAALETNMEGNLKTVITGGLPDMPEYWKYVRDMVLAELLPYEEDDVLAAAKSGELATFLKERSEFHIGQVREMEKRRAERIAAGAAGKAAGTTKPLGGAAPVAAVEEGPVRGAGVGGMTKRLRGGLGLTS